MLPEVPIFNKKLMYRQLLCSNIKAMLKQCYVPSGSMEKEIYFFILIFSKIDS